MRKKLLLLLATSFVHINTYALPEGFNFGLGAGAAFNNGDFRYGDVDATERSGMILQGGKMGFNAIFLVGYNMPMNNAFDVDLQFDGQLNGSTARPLDVWQRAIPGGGTTRFGITEKNISSFGLTVRPILNVNQDASFFFVLGYRQGKFQNSISEKDPGRTTMRVSRKTNRRGYEFGFGFQTALTQTTSIRFEVEQTRYKRKNVVNVQAPITMDMSSSTRVTHALISAVWNIEKS